jgi:hypothetical protein
MTQAPGPWTHEASPHTGGSWKATVPQIEQIEVPRPQERWA